MLENIVNVAADIYRKIFLKRIARKYKLNTLNTCCLNPKKFDDTFYILGSGVTINQLNDNNWLGVKQEYTVGMKNGLVN